MAERAMDEVGTPAHLNRDAGDIRVNWKEMFRQSTFKASDNHVDDFVKGNQILKTPVFSLHAGKHFRTSENVVIKKFTMDRDASDPAAEDLGLGVALVRSAAGVQSCVHAGSVALHKIERKEDDAFLVMENFNRDLRSLIKNELRTAPLRKHKQIIAQILVSLHFCHSNNVFHRNVKPNKIMVSDAGMVKLEFFETSRNFDDRNKRYSPRPTCLSFTAPELLIREKYSCAVDIWGVACTLGEMLRGSPLFGQFGMSEVCIMFEHFKLLGYPSYDDWEEFHLSGMYNPDWPAFQATGLRSVLPDWVDDLTVDFMMQLLRFNPAKRPTAEQALSHAWFDEIRNELPSLLPSKTALMLSRQRQDLPIPTYVTQHPAIRPVFRVMLVDYLSEIHGELQMKPQTLCRAVQIMDRYLSHVSDIPRAQFQNVGSACLWLASKLEEVKVFPLQTFCQPGGFDHVLQREWKIFKKLKGDLSTPTAHTFLCHMQENLQLPAQQFHMAEYLVMIALLDITFLALPPSCVAAAAVRLAIRAFRTYPHGELPLSLLQLSGLTAAPMMLPEFHRLTLKLRTWHYDLREISNPILEGTSRTLQKEYADCVVVEIAGDSWDGYAVEIPQKTDAQTPPLPIEEEMLTEQMVPSITPPAKQQPVASRETLAEMVVIEDMSAMCVTTPSRPAPQHRYPPTGFDTAMLLAGIEPLSFSPVHAQVLAQTTTMSPSLPLAADSLETPSKPIGAAGLEGSFEEGEYSLQAEYSNKGGDHSVDLPLPFAKKVHHMEQFDA